MATITNPFNKIKLLFQGLAGGLDKELDDEEGYDKEELAQLQKMSEKGVNAMEQSHGIQTMVVDDDKEEKDRLGIKKPKTLNRSEVQKATETQNRTKGDERE